MKWKRIAVLTLVALLPLAAIPASPAHAANEVAVSRDGTSWAPTLPEPLFDPSLRWVPGDVQENSFWVRNQASTAGDLAIRADISDPDALITSDAVRVEVRTPAQSWLELSPSGEPLPLRTLPAGDRIEVTIRLSFGPAADNSTQRDRAALAFRVLLSQSGGPAAPPTDSEPADPPGSGEATLPDTGAPPLGAAVAAAALLVALGRALSHRSIRTHRRSTDHAAR